MYGGLSQTNEGVVSMQDIMRKITDRSAHVGVLGLGYVGLPLAIMFKQPELQRRVRSRFSRDSLLSRYGTSLTAIY